MPHSTSRIGRDRGLQARMLLTMFLLGALYVVFMGVLFAAGAGVMVIVLFAAGLLAIQYFASDKIALASMGAREVSPQDAPELHRMIERLCVQADLPKPRIAMVQSSMPNAFALGRSPKHATVCATTAITELAGTAFESWVQGNVPETHLARVGAVETGMLSAMNPLGIAVSVPLAGVHGAGPMLFGFAAVIAVAAIAVGAVSRSMRTSPVQRGVGDRH